MTTSPTTPVTGEVRHTAGEWRLVDDAQGPCMVMHPTLDGVAIASLTHDHLPSNGFHDNWYVWSDDGVFDEEAAKAGIAERNANARLMAAAPDLLTAAYEALHFITDIDNAHPSVRALRSAIAKASHIPTKEPDHVR